MRGLKRSTYIEGWKLLAERNSKIPRRQRFGPKNQAFFFGVKTDVKISVLLHPLFSDTVGFDTWP